MNRLKAIWIALTRPNDLILGSMAIEQLKEINNWSIYTSLKNTDWNKKTQSILDQYYGRKSHENN